MRGAIHAKQLHTCCFACKAIAASAKQRVMLLLCTTCGYAATAVGKRGWMRFGPQGDAEQGVMRCMQSMQAACGAEHGNKGGAGWGSGSGACAKGRALTLGPIRPTKVVITGVGDALLCRGWRRLQPHAPLPCKAQRPEVKHEV